MTKYSETHLESVRSRINVYNKVIKQDGFTQLRKCNTCDTVPHEPSGTPDCSQCLFGDSDGPAKKRGCHVIYRMGGMGCNNKLKQILQRRLLERSMLKNGFKMAKERLVKVVATQQQETEAK